MALDPALRDELLAMAEEDERCRRRLRGDGVWAHPAQHRELRDGCERRADRLWEILDDYECWPGRRLVGEDGAGAAWLLAQHAVFDPGLQRRCLELLELAVDCGDAPAPHYAYLYDRVCVADGRDQLYGSQFVGSDDGATLVPWPTEDPEHVDGRRRAVGLPSMAEQLRALGEQYRRRARS